ncbi:protein phosphatase 1 regulatory subunit 35 isoform X2 [Solea solea]|uniref:protein phosphatase 1 regulatory subunit 35 isoform X2 n=1 Tax=Solea solea TaxID=90069 RepID=UPI0027298AD1|nr:protein phosphatase 1 regulatory subunit 35 isoform X2 [Solea solea]
MHSTRMRSSSSLLSSPHSPLPAPRPLMLTSSVSGCPELDLSVVASPAPKSERAKLHHRSHAQTARKKDAQMCCTTEQPAEGTVTLEPHFTSHQQPVRVLRQLLECPADPGCTESAGLNSTLALKAELQSLQGAEFNSQRAIQETLRRSERTKNLINTRATEVVNVSRSQHLFTSLVSVSVQKDRLLSQSLHDRALTHPHSQDLRAAHGPSLDIFMSSNMVRQKPLPPNEEPVHDKPKPSSRPAHSTFDLFRRQRRWEGTS